MKVFVSKTRDAVWVQIRAEGDGAIGDLTQMLTSGKSFLGHDYDWWAALPQGEHEVSPPE